MARFRVRELTNGEGNSHFFANLEKHNSAKKTINSLISSDSLIENPKDILREISKFYEELYSSKIISNSQYFEKLEIFFAKTLDRQFLIWKIENFLRVNVNRRS